MLLAIGCATPAFDEGTWAELTSEHFQLVSNADEALVRTVAEELELIRRVVFEWTGVAPFEASVRPQVYVFKDYDSYRHFEYTLWSDGFFVSGMDGGALVMNAGVSQSRVMQLANHEYVHLVLRGTGHRHYPPWYNEGLAELLSTARPDGDVVFLGEPPDWILDQLASMEPLSIANLVSEESLRGWFGAHRQTFYAHAWGLVHLLRLGGADGRHPDRSEELARYLDLVTSRVPPVDALEQAFGATANQLSEELERYLWERRFPAVSVSMADASPLGEMAVRPLPLDEVNYRLGRLAQLMGPDFDDLASELLGAAIAINPDNMRAVASLALAEQYERDSKEVLLRLRQAIKQAPDDPEVHVLYAKYLIGWVAANRPKGEPLGRRERSRLRQARDSLERSIELEPGPPDAYYWLGTASWVEGTRTQSGIEALEIALQKAPWNGDTSLRLARLYMRKEEFDRARVLLEDLAGWPDSSRQATRARALLGYMDSPQFRAAESAPEEEAE